jgi:hypothetical protein
VKEYGRGKDRTETRMMMDGEKEKKDAENVSSLKRNCSTHGEDEK